MVPVLSRLLTTERHRQRMGLTLSPSIPMMLEREVDPSEDPLLVTNTRGKFVETRRNLAGMGRYAFTPCQLEEEPLLLQELFTTMRAQLGAKPSLVEALSTLPTAKSIVLSETLVSQVLGENLSVEKMREVMNLQGYLAMVDGRQILSCPFPAGSAMVLAAPKNLGVYTRVGDYVGIQIFSFRTQIVPVQIP